MADYYTWAEFRAKVLELLPIDANRKGVGMTAFLESLIRQGVIRLQSTIPQFTINHECLYFKDDLAQEGHALRGTKPPESIITKARFCRMLENGDKSIMHEAVMYPYEDRFDLICRRQAVNDGKARLAIDKQGYTFYVYPAPPECECWVLSVFWDGKKLDFQDDEQVPFTEMAADAVASFVRARTTLETDKDVTLSAAHLSNFGKTKTLIFLDEKEKASLGG